MGTSTKQIRLIAALVIVGLAVTAYVIRPTVEEPDESDNTTTEATALPRLLDLGADKCVPCKMMAPILDQMKEDYAGIMTVEFIDVWKNPDAAKPYGIKIIPTQIFYDAGGNELFRHEGFYSREDILAKFREFGVDLPESGV